MNNNSSPVSLLSQYFLTSCYGNGLYRKVSSYSAELSKQSASLEAARNAFRGETETIINSFKTMQSIHQVATKIRHASLPVQYFIFERASLLSHYEFFRKDPPEYLTHTDDKSAQMFYLLLQLLWDDTLKLLNEQGIVLNNLLSDLFHGYL